MSSNGRKGLLEFSQQITVNYYVNKIPTYSAQVEHYPIFSQYYSCSDSFNCNLTDIFSMETKLLTLWRYFDLNNFFVRSLFVFTPTQNWDAWIRLYFLETPETYIVSRASQTALKLFQLIREWWNEMKSIFGLSGKIFHYYNVCLYEWLSWIWCIYLIFKQFLQKSIYFREHSFNKTPLIWFILEKIIRNVMSFFVSSWNHKF